jgi:hypothetical protein
MRVDKLSVTQIGTPCVMRIWHVLTIGYKPPNFNLFFGSTFHAANAFNYKQKARSHKDLKTDEVIDAFKFEWDNEKDKVVWEKDDPPKRKAKDLGIDVTKEFHEKVNPTIQPLLKDDMAIVEYPLKFKVTDNIHDPLNISGKIDVQMESLILSDLKTAKNKWQAGREEKEIQAYLYPFGMNLNGHKVKGFQFDIAQAKLGKTKKTVNVDRRPVKYKAEMADMFIRQGIAMAEMLRKEQPVKNTSGWWCSEKYCGYWKECMGEQKTYSIPQVIDEVKATKADTSDEVEI